jgi:predicted AAA+ superfamily ATPase
MYTRIFKPLKLQSFLLLGPRGTGKSTFLKSFFPEALYIDLLKAENFNSLLANPSRLENLIPSQFSQFVIIDEIQRIPELLNEVHRLIEDKKIHFILTGSSARQLRKKGTNLLAGRARTFHFYPLTHAELGADFNLEKSIQFGHLPEAYTKDDPMLYLKSYVQTYLKEEIDQEGLTRNLSAFARFLESASFSQAQPLNISKVADDCHVDRKVTEGYFKILEDLMIAERVPVFTRRAKRKMGGHPKFFFFDCGVYQAIRPRGPLDSPEEIQGPAWETLVWQELRARNEYSGWGYDIFTWRTQAKQEVDLILYGEKGLHAIEVKRSDRIRREDLESLQLFKNDYPMAQLHFIYGGKEQKILSDIKIWPIENFLKEISSFGGK